MSQRAAGNGYSWWWASHIRTKQSKWLEQNLQDMEDKVEHVLNLIQKDGDSFARRAEMYYKHRPELISFVEETVRAYRSLAERYDKLSTELQKANTTIASICPEKVTYDDYDDDFNDGPSKTPKSIPQNTIKAPKTPKLPGKGTKGLNNASKKSQASKKIQTDDVIEDDDARTSMAEATLKSCEETLDVLQKKHEKSSQEARLEQQRLDEAKQKLESLKHEFNLDNKEEKDVGNVSNQDDQKELEAKNKESFEGLSKNPLTAEELAETIEKVVNKVISLESSVSSETALINMLRSEVNDLETQIRNLENNKAAPIVKEAVDESKVVKKYGMDSQEMLSGLEEKENILLEEYLTTLRNYKDTEKKLTEEEKRKQGTLSPMTGHARQLKSAIVKRDNEIQLLKQKLKLLQETFGKDTSAENEEVTSLDEPQPVSAIEEMLRMDIDAILDENLEFWLRFSTVFHQVQKFKTQVEDLQEEVKKVKAKGLVGKSSTDMFTTDLISDIRPIYKQLKEINNELTTWLKRSKSLKYELQMRSSALSNIQTEITRVLRQGVEEEEIKFSTHQAEKFQGEILNIKQENNKVNKELQAGLDHATALKLEIEQNLERLEQEFGLSDNKNQPHQGRSKRRSRITLRSFLFGGKAKKQKSCFFACLGHHKKSSAYKGGSK